MDKQEQAAEQLFGEALDLPRDQRQAFLDRVCADKPALRRRVEDLLDEKDKLSGLLSEPAIPHGSAPAAMASHTAVLTSGKRLVDRYEIIGKLGAGGMGIVYRAHDEKLDREVAIKMLQPGVLAGDESRARFHREARALAKLNHAHIAAVHDVIEQDGADYIVMELVAGESLASRLRRGALSVKEATTIALQVAEALEEAHEQGVIHRDLKPANVMITPKGQAKVLDFGLARLQGLSDVTQTMGETAGAMGTPLYMSPEQAIGQKADARSDLWSLGVTYYESLTGVEAFRRATTLAIMRAITDEGVRPVSEVRPQVPALAEQIVARALEKDPELRYQYARDFSTDLRRVLRDLEPGRVTASGSTVSGTTKSRTSKVGPWVGGSTAVAIAAAALAFWLRPAIPPPHVTGMAEITHDQTPKVDGDISQRLLTDGPRLYYEVEGSTASTLKQVSSAGGDAEVIAMPLRDHQVADLRDSELLTLGDPLNAEGTEGAVWHLTLPGGQIQRIGNMQASDAAWGPDKNSVYWSHGPVISLTRTDGTGTHAILTTKGKVGNIAFSPDGSRMRFTVETDASSAALWEAQPDGTSPRRLFSDADGMAYHCCGQWTPDGKYYLFQSNRGGSSNLWATREKLHWWEKVNPAPVQLTVGPMAARLPLPALDGKHIFFVGTAQRDEVMRFTGPKSMESVLPGTSVENLAYSRDGKRIAWVALPDLTLWEAQADGSNRRQLTFAPWEAALPNWSPDDRHIAFSGLEPGKKRHIYTVSDDDTYPQLVSSGETVDGDPTWSPDGQSIAFGGITIDYADAKSHPIEIVDLRTRKVTSLPGSEGLAGARWSPDGKFIVAEATPSGVGPLMLYSFATKAWSHLGPSEGAYVTWSHDSRCVYYSQYEAEYTVYRICLADRKPQVMIKMSGAAFGQFGTWFGLAPDDSVLGLHSAGIEEIYRLDLNLP